MTEDAYRDFAERYDLFFEESGRHSPAEVGFFRRLFSEHKVANVLDCFTERFDAVLCLSTSLLEAGGKEEILSALQSIQSYTGFWVGEVSLC